MVGLEEWRSRIGRFRGGVMYKRKMNVDPYRNGRKLKADECAMVFFCFVFLVASLYCGVENMRVAFNAKEIAKFWQLNERKNMNEVNTDWLNERCEEEVWPERRNSATRVDKGWGLENDFPKTTVLAVTWITSTVWSVNVMYFAMRLMTDIEKNPGPNPSTSEWNNGADATENDKRNECANIV